MHVLIIEDEAKLAAAMREGFEQHGVTADSATTGEAGLELLDARDHDAVVLDLGLPGLDGFPLLEAIRARAGAIPIVIVTARDTVDDRVRGLDLGADDYLVKPFAFPELLARVRAVTRRGGSPPPLRVTVADLEIDLIARSVTRAGEAVTLTTREFELLEFIVRHRPQPVTRRMLAEEVWREPARATTLDNVIDVHVARLRRKLDDGRPTSLIRTVRGVGFAIEPDAR